MLETINDYYNEKVEMLDTILENMESMVDIRGIGATLELLAQVCYIKAEHVETNWQDKQAARVWIKIGKKIERLASKVSEDEETLTLT